MRIENGIGWVEEDGKRVSATTAQYVAEITQLRGNLSLAEEGLANYALEVAQLRLELRSWIVANGPGGWIDTLRRRAGYDPAFANRSSEPQSASIDSVSGNDYSTVHGEDESGTDPCAAREAREAGPKEV